MKCKKCNSEMYEAGSGMTNLTGHFEVVDFIAWDCSKEECDFVAASFPNCPDLVNESEAWSAPMINLLRDFIQRRKSQ